MFRFNRRIVQQRTFPSYEYCPDIYYRFNGKGEYGPQKLDRVISFFAARSDEVIEGRFADEEQWRPLSYFLDLWERVPPSAHTIKRLKREGIDSEGVTESLGRKLLRDKQKSKTLTPRQIEYLKNAGIEMEEAPSRGQAEEVIRAREKAISEGQQRLAEAPEIEGYNQRLQELKARVRVIVPDWTPREFSDAMSLLCYVNVVEDAFDHATGFDLVALQSGPFSDGVTDSDYYLEFSRDPTLSELRGFQAQVFLKYLEVECEEFDHLAILKRTLPMIEVSVL